MTFIYILLEFSLLKIALYSCAITGFKTGSKGQGYTLDSMLATPDLQRTLRGVFLGLRQGTYF